MAANKYNAKKIHTSAGTFDSTGEYEYYKKLQLLKNASNPSERVELIERQITFSFVVNGIVIGNYRSDFYITYADGHKEVHDFKNPYLVFGKGKATPAGQIFNYKKKLMKALHNIEIKVVTK